MLQGLIAVMPQGTLPSEAICGSIFRFCSSPWVATTLAGLLAGSAPAWYASRIDPGETLKEGGRTGMSAGKHRLRRVLVIGEFALALALLAGAGLAIHSFWNLTRVDLGIRTDHVLAFSLPVPDSRSKDPAQISAYYRDILAHIDAVPGSFPRGGDHWLSPVWRRFGHAIRNCGRTHLRRSIAAARGGLWHGHSRLRLDLWASIS